MSEKHRMGADGVLNDGVSHYPADEHDLQSYRDAQKALSQMPVPILVSAHRPHERLFLAAFDGTGNDGDNDPENASNVHYIREQIRKNGNPQIAAGYVPGPGTQRNPIARMWDGARGHTYDERAEEMYKQLIEQAWEWQQQDPNVQIRIVSIGFSRGGEQAAGFTRLVQERGIQDFAGAKYTYDAKGQIKHVEFTKPPLVAPGQIAQAVGLFDPVGTGQPVKEKDRRLPPSVISGFQPKAKDERRGLFKSSHIIDPGMTPDGRLLGVVVGGAHSNLGGTYHRHGLGARSANLMIDYLNALSDTPFLEKQPEPDDPRLNVVHLSEEGMLLYRLGRKVDRLQPEGYVSQLVPDRMRGQVEDPDNAEPRDEALAQQFEWRYVTIGPVPEAEPHVSQPQEVQMPSWLQDSSVHHAQALDPFEKLYRACLEPDDEICRAMSRDAVNDYLRTPDGQQFQHEVRTQQQLLDAWDRQQGLEAQLLQMQQEAQQQQETVQRSHGMSR
jgi:hypothetical protein